MVILRAAIHREAAAQDAKRLAWVARIVAAILLLPVALALLTAPDLAAQYPRSAAPDDPAHRGAVARDGLRRCDVPARDVAGRKDRASRDCRTSGACPVAGGALSANQRAFAAWMLVG